MKKIILALILILPLFLLAKENVVKVNDILSAEVVNDTIIATLNIPKDMHMNLQEDFCFIEADEISGITFGKTVYPDNGEEHDGIISFHGTIQMKKSFKVDPKVKLSKIKVYIGYQFCYDTYCEPPEEFEVELNIR